MKIIIKNLRIERPIKENQIRIDRRYSILANPYYMQDESKRDEVCNKYEKYFNEQIKTNKTFLNELRRLYKLAKTHGTLELFCWCAPKRCHGETIKNFLEKYN